MGNWNIKRKQKEKSKMMHRPFKCPHCERKTYAVVDHFERHKKNCQQINWVDKE